MSSNIFKKSATISLATLLLFGLSHNAFGQSHHLPLSTSTQVTLEIMKPNLEEAEGVKTLSSVQYLSSKFPVGNGNLVITTELPIVFYDQESGSIFSEFNSELMIGNILLDFEFRNNELLKGGFGHLGVRLPVAEDDKYYATFYGLFTDYYRLEAFIPNQFSIQAGGGWRIPLSEASTSNTQLHVGITTMAMISTKSGTGSDVFTKYYGQFWYLAKMVGLGIGIDGVALVSESGLDLAERTEHQLTFDLNMKFGQLTPGVFMRIPIADELKEVVGFVGGINISVEVP